MRCIVNNCTHDSNSTSSQGITFHIFPSEPLLRARWLKALGKQGWNPTADSSVCSNHFLTNDLYLTTGGLCKLQEGAVPMVLTQDPKPKKRKRVANFSTYEKTLLMQLIKKRPVIESKLTDGKSVIKKKEAWDVITKEFNSNTNVLKRETITLKRAWENMKARQSRTTDSDNLISTKGESNTPPPSQHEARRSIVEEGAHTIIYEIKNSFDSDNGISNDTSQELNLVLENTNKDTTVSVSIDPLDHFKSENENNCETIEGSDDSQNSTSYTENHEQKPAKQPRKPAYYIRREAVMRIKHLEHRKNMDTQILNIRLEIEKIKKKAAVIEEDSNKIILEKAKIDLEKATIELEKAKIELENMKKSLEE